MTWLPEVDMLERRAVTLSVVVAISCRGLTAVDTRAPDANIPDTESADAWASDSSSSDAPNANTPCAQLGGVCQMIVPENFTCQQVAGAFEYHGLCGSSSIACCVIPNANGDLPPPLNGYGICGGIICAPGSTCVNGVDFEACDGPGPLLEGGARAATSLAAADRARRDRDALASTRQGATVSAKALRRHAPSN